MAEMSTEIWLLSGNVILVTLKDAAALSRQVEPSSSLQVHLNFNCNAFISVSSHNRPLQHKMGTIFLPQGHDKIADGVVPAEVDSGQDQVNAMHPK